MPADQVFRQKGSVKRQRQKAASKSSVKKQRQLVSEMAPTGGWHGDIRLQIIEMQRSFITNSIQLERNYLIASVRFSAARSSATCAGPPSLGSAAMSLRSCKRTPARRCCRVLRAPSVRLYTWFLCACRRVA